jgi:hypothetical protein
LPVSTEQRRVFAFSDDNGGYAEQAIVPRLITADQRTPST